MLGVRTTDPVGTLLEEVVATVLPSTTLRAASRQLARELVGLLVVVDRGGIRGVLSERDVIAAVADEADLDAERVIDHATDHIVAVDVGTSIAEAAATMSAAEVRHLAVSRHAEIVGVVSARDLVAVLAESPDDEALTPA